MSASKSASLTAPALKQALKMTAKDLQEAQKASNRAFNSARRSVSKIQTSLSQTPGHVFDKPDTPSMLGAAASANVIMDTPKPTTGAAANKRKRNNPPKPTRKAMYKGSIVAPAGSKQREKKSVPKPKDNVSGAAAKETKKQVAIESSESSDDGSAIFWASTGMTPPSAQDKTAMEKTFNDMDAVSPGLSDGLEDGEESTKTPTNTPTGKGETDDDLALAQSSVKRKRKILPSPSAAAPAAKRPSPTKECPSCGEKIACACRKCPHCGASALKQDYRSKRERKRRQERLACEDSKRAKKTYKVTDQTKA